MAHQNIPPMLRATFRAAAAGTINSAVTSRIPAVRIDADLAEPYALELWDAAQRSARNETEFRAVITRGVTDLVHDLRAMARDAR